MTGPEHYRLAERLLDKAADQIMDSGTERSLLARARVHATLALAAATAIPQAGQMPVLDCEAWERVAGEEMAFTARVEAAVEAEAAGGESR